MDKDNPPREQLEERRVISLEQAGENFGVEDTPSNAPEEIEARRRLDRKVHPDDLPEPSDASEKGSRGA